LAGLIQHLPLAAFVSNWANYAKLFPLLLSRITIGVSYPGTLCSMAALRRAFRNLDRQSMFGRMEPVGGHLATMR
jgi:hypothetical protein